MSCFNRLWIGSTAVLTGLLLSLPAFSQAQAKDEAPFFQVSGGKKSFFKLRTTGNPPEIVWTREDFPNGFYFNPGETDWTKYNAVEFDLVSDGVPVYFQFRANNDRPNVFLYEEFNVRHKGSKHIILPIKKLKTNTKPVDLTKIVIGHFTRDDSPDTPNFTLTIRNLKLSNLSGAELEKAAAGNQIKFQVCKGETGFRGMPEKTSLFKVSQARVKQIASYLPDKPVGLIPNYKDRNFWEKEYPPCSGLISAADHWITGMKLKKVELSIFPEMLTSPKRDKRGERPGYYDWWYGAVMNCFRVLDRMTIAECKVNDGRYLPKLMEAMDVLLDMPTWDLDPKTLQTGLRYFESHSAMIATNLAISAYLLDDKLPPAMRARIKEKLDEWALTPAFKALSVSNSRQRSAQLQGGGWAFWYDVENNMNPYFYNYLLQTALVSLESKEHRAWIIANAEEAIKLYFRRYTKDGYITEGMGYWLMGLSNAMQVDYVIRRATNGKEAIFKGDFPGVKPLILGYNMVMVPTSDKKQLYPHFGDHGVDGKPDEMNYHLPYLMCDLLAGKPYYGDMLAGQAFGTYGGIMLSSDIVSTVSAIDLRKIYPGSILPPSDREEKQGYFGRISPDYKKIVGKGAKGIGLTFLANDQDCGILISRDYLESKLPFSLAIKGGNNGEGHGHDDCGSYCIGIGKRMAFGDPGVPVYYHATQKFANESYAHPVPFPAGTMQTRGSKGYSKVIQFKDSQDVTTITYDLKNAYAVPTLKKLTRTAVHDRKARTITITDSFEFSRPETFDTALTSYAVPKEITPGTWQIGNARVAFKSNGGETGFKQEKLKPLMRNYKPIIRLACRFKGKVKSGEITYVISPDATAQ